jgi:hypothetical protein
MSGPAVTLKVEQNTKVTAVDLVPVFCFGTKRWPPRPARQLSDLPWWFSSPWDAVGLLKMTVAINTYIQYLLVSYSHTV